MNVLAELERGDWFIVVTDDWPQVTIQCFNDCQGGYLGIDIEGARGLIALLTEVLAQAESGQEPDEPARE